eukprot:scaffold26115_cov132-Cylindrotheca_fusiformis.AAC.5
MAILSIFSKKKNAAQSMMMRESTTTTNMKNSDKVLLEDRLRGALWSFMAGDALAAPTHWYYGGTRQVIEDYGTKLTDYTKPKYYLAGSILNKSDLNGGGRRRRQSGGSNGEQQQQKTIIGDVINHGKQDLWSPRESIHYHATLEKGENTLEVQLARVLMKSIVEQSGKFDPDHFRESYIKFMMTPNSHNDTYASTCHRMFFSNLIHAQLPPKDCPDNDHHNVDTIDSLVLPTIVAMAESCRQPTADSASKVAAAQCLAVTRKSNLAEQMASQWTTVVHAALHEDSDEEFMETFQSFSKQTIGRLPNPKVSDSSTMSACYISQSLPGMLDMIAKYLSPKRKDPWNALLANANVGGENVHRGSIMGAILGARSGYNSGAVPAKLMDGLYHKNELAKEIDDFINAILLLSPPPSDNNTKDEKNEEL